MRYMGGKSRIAKELAGVMLGLSDNRAVYVEPFVGGGAVAEQMSTHFGEVHLSDLHPDLMMMWNAVINEGWVPPTEVTYEQYQELRYATEPSALRGFVGFGCSFGGRWFEGYARYQDTNFAQSSHNVVTRQAKKIGAANVFVADFSRLPAVSAAPVIYCDPPYADTKGYSKTGAFPHDTFWAKAEEWSDAGAHVFVSEYNAPTGWVPVWEKEVVGQLDLRKERDKPIEKLFVREGVFELESRIAA